MSKIIDYEKYIDALDYVKDVCNRMESLTTKEFFLRKGETDDLIKEEWVLACFGKILYHPDRRVKILYQGKKDTPDAQIIIEGRQKQIEGWDDVTAVEITSAYFPNFYLVNKELAEKGYSEGALTSVNEDIEKFIPEAIKSLRKKYSYSYPENTILICRIFPEKSFGIANWNMLLDEISKQLAGLVKYKTVILDTFTCQYFIIKPQNG